MTWKGLNSGLRWAIFISIILIAAGVVVVLWYFAQRSDADFKHAELPSNSANNSGRLTVEPELQLYKPITAEQAEKENEQLPFSSAPIERALPLILPSSQLLPIGRRNAIDCLSSAIYYEAGNESDQGKRGVAQVILNRVRHPAFPNSICGVVYQGSERRTGCQFTFTCDGSLARRPSRNRWEKSRLIAIGAISGAVEPTVGMSTHYHANYVVPYWAPSLNKIVQVGSHIFYRWKGAQGRRQAFVQAVQLDNEKPVNDLIDENILVPDEETFKLDLPIKPPSRIIADDRSPVSTPTYPSLNKTVPVVSEILADRAKSTLTADEQKSTLKQDKLN